MTRDATGVRSYLLYLCGGSTGTASLIETHTRYIGYAVLFPFSDFRRVYEYAREVRACLDVNINRVLFWLGTSEFSFPLTR